MLFAIKARFARQIKIMKGPCGWQRSLELNVISLIQILYWFMFGLLLRNGQTRAIQNDEIQWPLIIFSLHFTETVGRI